MAKKQTKPEERRVQRCLIDKWLLLQILKEDEQLPEAATKIIATGHTPEHLIVTVAFD